jgi:hypothetical protein
MIMPENTERTAMHEAVKSGQKEVVKLFLDKAFTERRRILNAKDENGRAALHLAALLGIYFFPLIKRR